MKEEMTTPEAQNAGMDKLQLDEAIEHIKKEFPNTDPEFLEQVKKESVALVHALGMINEHGDQWLLNGLQNAADRVDDTFGLPLSVDPVYQEVAGACEKFSKEYVKLLAENVQKTTGSERLKRTRALRQIGLFVDESEFAPYLKTSQSREEFIKALEMLGRQEQKEEMKKESWWSRFKGQK